MRKIILVLGVMFGLMLHPQQAAAHGGGLNSSDCHNETATGGYHCHRDKTDDFDWVKVGAVAGGLLAAWLLVEWLADDENVPESRLHLVPRFTEKEAGIIAEYTVDRLHRVGISTLTHTDDRQDTYAGVYWRFSF